MNPDTGWEGHVSSNWYVPANWTRGILPLPGDHIQITIGDHAYAPSFTGTLANLTISLYGAANADGGIRPALSGEALGLANTRIELSEEAEMVYPTLTIAQTSSITTWKVAAYQAITQGSAVGTLDNLGQIEDSTSTLDVHYANVINKGFIGADSGGSLFIHGISLINDGLISATGGATTEILSNNTSGSGKFDVADGGLLAFTGNVAPNIGVDFGFMMSSGIGNLEIGKLGGFHAKVYGFDRGDVLMVDHANVTSATWSGGSLTLSQNGQNLGSISLVGDYAGDRFLTSYNPTNQVSSIVIA